MKSQHLLIHAAAIVDGEGVNFAPGAMVLDHLTGRVLAADVPERIGPVPDAEALDLTSSVVIPALVNAHAHLDLTHIGPLPWPAETRAGGTESTAGPGDFVSWVDVIRAKRAVEAEDVRASVIDGAARSMKGGTAYIGDIAGVGSIAAAEALRDSDLAGVSYLEIFGQGSKEDATIASLDSLEQQAADAAGCGVRIGLQPHAPYSCSRRVYLEAARRGLPLATHLAETREELSFVRDADGPLAELLKRLGVWDERIEPTGRHPIDHLADVFAQHPFLAVHLNYVEDRHLDQLADWPISVVYCPRASAYFGHGKWMSGNRDGWKDNMPIAESHRYREMLDRGINLALGTDSILCLDTPDRISVLDDMRLLHERDGADPRTLLRMATVNGARGLGIDLRYVTFSPGSTPGILALPIGRSDLADPLREAICSASSVAALQVILKPRNVAAPSVRPWKP